MAKSNADARDGARWDALVHVFDEVMNGSVGDFATREARVHEVANELARQWLERQLQQMADQFGDVVEVNGQRHRRHAGGKIAYHSLCGPLTVQRDSYRLVGLHNGPTVVPLELAAGIRARATPALIHSVAHGFAIGTLRDYAEAMALGHRIVPSRTTLERVAKTVATRLAEDLPALEASVRETEPIPRQGHSITVGVDRTTAPMAEPTGAVCNRDEPPYLRQPPPEVTVHYRMAYVATVAVNDATGRVLTSKRTASTVEAGTSDLLAWLAAEVTRLLAERPDLPVVVIQDGAPELWNLIDAWAGDFAIPITLKLLDRYHVDERLSAVAEIIEPEPDRRRQLVARWQKSIARSDLALMRLARSFYALVHDIYDDKEDEVFPFGNLLSRARIHGAPAKVVDDHQYYLRRHASLLSYKTARNRGFPIGSGVTEGACKSLIAARCKRSGQRWQDHGLTRCLQLRSLHLNERLAPCIDRHLKEGRAGFLAA